MAGEKKRDKVKEMFWRKALERQRQSGLTQAEFCKREQLALSQFSWWKNEISKRDALAEALVETNGSFVPLAILEPPQHCETPQSLGAIAEIDLDRRVLRIFNGVDMQALRSLLNVLREK